MRLRACHGPPGSSRRVAALEARGEADRAGLDSFLDIEIDKSISMSAPPRVEEDAMPRRVYITRSVQNQYGNNGRLVWDAPTVPFAERDIHHSEECRRRIENEMKNDPEQRERIQETKRKRRESRNTPRSSRSTRVRRKNRMTSRWVTLEVEVLKRKTMEVMDCMCESPIDVVNIVEEDGMLEEYKADDCMEETTRNWADMTEEEHAEPKTFHDNLTGKALKHEKVIEARLDEIEVLEDMGVWEVVPVA